MSRSGERRKPRAESRVKALADENAALRADRSSLETRVKELRAELDAGARLHREVRTRLEETKARLEGENAGIQGRLNERDRAALKLTGQLIEAKGENTRLLEAVRLAVAIICLRPCIGCDQPTSWRDRNNGAAPRCLKCTPPEDADSINVCPQALREYLPPYAPASGSAPDGKPVNANCEHGKPANWCCGVPR